MSYSEVAICNIALSLLVSQPIRSLSDQGKKARLCYNFYPIIRDYTLYKYDWPFAHGRMTMQQVTDLTKYNITVDTGEGYYLFPSDCLKPRGLEPAGTGDKWKQVGRGVVTTMDSPILLYTRAVSNTSLFSMSFINALKFGLAAHLAHPLTGDDRLTDKYSKLFEMALADGGMQDMNIGSGYKNPDDIPGNDTFVNPDGLYDTTYDDNYFLKLKGV